MHSSKHFTRSKFVFVVILALCFLSTYSKAQTNTNTAKKDGSEKKVEVTQNVSGKIEADKSILKPSPAVNKTKPAKPSRIKPKPFVNKAVSFAPEANVTFGDDIDDEGACAAIIEKLCDDVEEGEGRLAECISDAITASETPDPDDDAEDISDKCREEVYQYKISRNSNINNNVPLARACSADADKYCNVTWFFGYKSGQVIACLRDVKTQVTKGCKKQLFKVMHDAAVDIRADPVLYEACKPDTESLCKDVKHGGGRIQACLRSKRMQLSWTCEEQLFRQEIENSDDIRLSVRLFTKCLGDKRKFCKDVEPGGARAKDCLEDHREELSTDCREEIDEMIESRVRDFRLDSKLRTACETEIFDLCAFFGDLDEVDSNDASVINCLQDYSGEIKNRECKAQVKKYMSLAAQDIRFNVPLAEACYEDRQKYCSNVPPGSARVIRCLQNSRNSLSPVCRATLFDEEVRFSENIDFQYPMKAACTQEVTLFCKDVPHGNARVIRCLQANKKAKNFGKACLAEVDAYESSLSKDYRLNHMLKKACEKDIDGLCNGICDGTEGQVCGGKVLRCLTDKQDELTSQACKNEVFYFEKMEVSNFRNDIILAEACRSDVDKFCKNTLAGEGRVHKCLRDHRKELSETCRKEELLLEEKEAENIELAVGLLKTCRAERQLFCKDVSPGSARVFRCLAENMHDADFGNSCKQQIVNKLQRRQANWKLDPPLRRACRSDVQSLCAAEDASNSEEGIVYTCLIRRYDDLSGSCQSELGRAVHMAIYVWQPGAVLTTVCDEDIKTLCLTVRPNAAQRAGAVASCLSGLAEREGQSSLLRALLATNTSTRFPAKGKLSDKCAALVNIAQPPDTKSDFETSLSFALLREQLEAVESTTGLSMLTRTRQGVAQGVSLTGWVALLGIMAFVVVLIFAGYTAYKRFRGIPDKDYTLVVKSHNMSAH